MTDRHDSPMRGDEHRFSPRAVDLRIGWRLRKLRAQRRLTRGKLSALTGLSVADLEELEAGTRRATGGELFHIVEQLGVPLSMFFTRPSVDEPQPVGAAVPALRRED